MTAVQLLQIFMTAIPLHPHLTQPISTVHMQDGTSSTPYPLLGVIYGLHKRQMRPRTYLETPVTTLVSRVAPPSGIALELESPSAADWLDFRKRNVRM